MNRESLGKWEGEAWALPGPVMGLRAPFAVMGEATDCARFVQRYMEPGRGGAGNVVRPGLTSVVGTGQFTANIADETLELLQALQSAQTYHQLLVERAPLRMEMPPICERHSRIRLREPHATAARAQAVDERTHPLAQRSGRGLRQWVPTFPFELRGRFGFDATLLSGCPPGSSRCAPRLLRAPAAGAGRTAARARKPDP